MKDFERVLETYMPLVINTTLRNMLPVLIKVVGCSEEGQPIDMRMFESVEDRLDAEEGATAENEHDA